MSLFSFPTPQALSCSFLTSPRKPLPSPGTTLVSRNSSQQKVTLAVHQSHAQLEPKPQCVLPTWKKMETPQARILYTPLTHTHLPLQALQAEGARATQPFRGDRSTSVLCCRTPDFKRCKPDNSKVQRGRKGFFFVVTLNTSATLKPPLLGPTNGLCPDSGERPILKPPWT